MGRRRFLAFALVPGLACASVAVASSSKPTSWAAPQIRALAAAGLMGATQDIASFRASDPLTAQSLEDLAFALKQRLTPLPVAPPPVVPPPTVTGPTVTGPTVTAPTVTAPTVTAPT